MARKAVTAETLLADYLSLPKNQRNKFLIGIQSNATLTTLFAEVTIGDAIELIRCRSFSEGELERLKGAVAGLAGVRPGRKPDTRLFQIGALCTHYRTERFLDGKSLGQTPWKELAKLFVDHHKELLPDQRTGETPARYRIRVCGLLRKTHSEFAKHVERAREKLNYDRLTNPT